MWIIISTVTVIILTIVLSMFLSRTQYVLAFQDLDTTDAAAVMAYLDSNNITYELSNAGQNISVPAANVDKVKVDAGSQGLVQNGSIGFESFADSSSLFGTTDREFDVKYRNALNGEIQKLLGEMRGVASAKALVTLPTESAILSTDEEEKASASVMLTFKRGYRPTQEEIDGYYNLVKTSVPKLPIENITISSPVGELAASIELGGASNGIAAIQNNLQMQRKYETDLKRNIQNFLIPLVGYDSVVVNVTSALNFDKKVSDQHILEPLKDNNNQGALISQGNSSSSSQGGGSSGATSTDGTSVPSYSGSNGGSGSTTEESSTTSNYEFSTIDNKIQSGPFTVKDLTVSVAIDKSKLSDEAKAEITQVVQQLVRSQLIESGQDVADDALIAKKVSVLAQTFAVEQVSFLDSLSQNTITLAGVLLALIIGLILFFTLRNKKRSNIADFIEPESKEVPAIDFKNESPEQIIRKQLETLSRNQPEEFAKLLRSWIVEE